MLTIASRSRILTSYGWICTAIVVISLVAILANIFLDGLQNISWTYLLSESENSGRSGGIAPIIVSTLMTVGVAMVVAVPIGIATALLLSEFSAVGGKYAELIRKSLDILAGVPSIVFGLFGNAFFCIWLGMGFSILSGGLTLSCMVLPLMIRTSEEGFRLLPPEYRLGMSALGFSRTASVFHLLLPAAAPAICTGIMLSFGRAIAETAALIFTSGYVDRMPESFLDSGRTLSVHIYDLAMNVPGGNSMAYSSALVLVVILACSSVFTSMLSKRVGQRGLRIQ